MSVSLGALEFEDGTTMGVLIDRGETKVLWFNIRVTDTVLGIVTTTGKESLAAAEVRPLKIDVELPIDINIYESIDKITVVSDVVNFSEVDNLPVVKEGYVNEFLLAACRMVISKLVTIETEESCNSDLDTISIIRQVIANCNTSKLGWELFGVQPVNVTVDDTVGSFKHSESLSDEARKLLAGSLLRKSIPIETIASKLLCSDIIASGIMDGKVGLTLTNFITLCKLAEHEPSDVLRAVGNNLTRVPTEWNNG